MNKLNDPRAGRRRLLLIGVMFAAPIVAAIALYYYLPESWRPQGRTNHGHLLTPVRPLVQAHLKGLDGQALDATIFHGHWTMLYIGSSDCDAACQNTLYLSRQVRTSLGRNTDRVQRIYVMTDHAHAGDLRALTDRLHPGLRLVKAEDNDAQDFLDFFSLDHQMKPQSAGNIYLLDPLGNWLMYYTPQDPAKGMLGDLKKLLLLSNIG